MHSTDYSSTNAAAMRDPSVVQTAVDHAKNTMDNAIGLSARVQQIVDRLLGSSPPTEAGKSGLQGISSGILPDLRDSSLRAQEQIEQANSALNRLEKSL